MSGFHRFYDDEDEHVRPEEVIMWARTHRLSSGRAVPVCLWGGRGVGKTQQIKAFCEDHDLELRTYHPAHDKDGSDIVGTPYHDPDSGETKYALPAWLPVEDDPPGILFIDEINRAPEGVLMGLMEVLGEGTISQSGWKLPDGWQIVVAANPSEVGYDVRTMDDAMIDRMLHYVPGWDAPAWAAWAQSAGLDPRVIDFVLRNQEHVEIGETDFPVEVSERLAATPRSFEYFAALYEPDMPKRMLRVIAYGLLGREVGQMFIDEHETAPPALRFDQILKPGYEDQLRRWRDANDYASIRASTGRVIAGLVGKDVDTEVVKKLGRYFGLLPDSERNTGLAALRRSAPDWAKLVEYATEKWMQHLASRGYSAIQR
jgi:hypothetical protein